MRGDGRDFECCDSGPFNLRYEDSSYSHFVIVDDGLYASSRLKILDIPLCCTFASCTLSIPDRRFAYNLNGGTYAYGTLFDRNELDA